MVVRGKDWFLESLGPFQYALNAKDLEMEVRKLGQDDADRITAPLPRIAPTKSEWTLILNLSLGLRIATAAKRFSSSSFGRRRSVAKL